MKKKFTVFSILVFSSVIAVQAQSVKRLPPPRSSKENLTGSHTTTIKLKDFLQRNTAVSSVGWKPGNNIVIHLKDGKEETYNLQNETIKKVFVAKYGTPPLGPPPPPPLTPRFPPPVIKKDA